MRKQYIPSLMFAAVNLRSRCKYEPTKYDRWLKRTIEANQANQSAKRPSSPPKPILPEGIVITEAPCTFQNKRGEDFTEHYPALIIAPPWIQKAERLKKYGFQYDKNFRIFRLIFYTHWYPALPRLCQIIQNCFDTWLDWQSETLKVAIELKLPDQAKKILEKNLVLASEYKYHYRPVEIKRCNLELLKKGCSQWHKNRSLFVKEEKKSLINYIRHQWTEYDYLLSMGKEVDREKINADIVKIYPELQ